jgi:hypothetical protein
MTFFEIRSRKLNGRIIFKVHGGIGYVWVKFPGEHDYIQCCVGGKLRGEAIACTPQRLPVVARRWWDQNCRLVNV